MIKVLNELAAWLREHHLKMPEVHLVFPVKEDAVKAKYEIRSYFSHLAFPYGSNTRLLGFTLRFKYKEVIEGEV